MGNFLQIIRLHVPISTVLLITDSTSTNARAGISQVRGESYLNTLNNFNVCPSKVVYL